MLVETKKDVLKVIQIFGKKNRQLQKIGQKSNLRQGFHNDMMRRKKVALIFPHIGFTSVPLHNRTHTNTKWQFLIWRSGLTEAHDTSAKPDLWIRICNCCYTQISNAQIVRAAVAYLGSDYANKL
jgi:hypothetical protein